jgi:hypothetical protein
MTPCRNGGAGPGDGDTARDGGHDLARNYAVYQAVVTLTGTQRSVVNLIMCSGPVVVIPGLEPLANCPWPARADHVTCAGPPMRHRDPG